MNIFEEYLKEITALILKNQKFLELKDLNKFKGVTVEVPPAEFNFELSCNVSLVLGKINKTNPKELANKIKYLIIKNLKVFNSVEIAGPGFIIAVLSVLCSGMVEVAASTFTIPSH